MTDVKICGLTEAGGVAGALEAGARYLGFVFFPMSPRHVTPERAEALARPARDRAEIVAVTVDADDVALEAVARALAPDYIQLHGAETPARAQAARRFARKGVIKALSVARSADLEAAAAYATIADLFLFDAKAPAGANRPGGNGAAFDWAILAGRTFARPWLLSGGLHAGNVAAAIAASGARAVDVSSGVERAPGVKDRSRVAEFLSAAQRAPG